MIQALTANRTDQPFREGILPWAPGCGDNLLHGQGLNTATKCIAIDRVTIPNQIPFGFTFRKHLGHLLSRPFRCRMFGDAKVKNSPALMLDDEENNLQVPKMVVASVVDDDGNQVYPRKWNHEFMDVPLVKKSKQNTPSFSSEIMAGLAKWKKPKERMLFVLCGSAGFRISEALGIEIDKHISSDFRTISVRQQARHCKVKTRLKTTNAVRDVDLHPAIASLLKAFIGERKSGFLFASRYGNRTSRLMFWAAAARKNCSRTNFSLRRRRRRNPI